MEIASLKGKAQSSKEVKLEPRRSDSGSFSSVYEDDKVVERLFHASRISSVASKIGFQKSLDKASNLPRIDRVAFTRDF
ncbi:hypothetical protein ES703_00851 [subsurface metagenome]